MRCSLLTLSSYLDHELPPEQSGELEAHLIACQRCSAGLGYLREEAERIRSLAPARALPGAADRLLIEVGLAAPLRPDDPFVPHSLEPTFEFSVDLRARAQRVPNGSGATAIVDALVVPDDRPATTEHTPNGAGVSEPLPHPAENGAVRHEPPPPAPPPVHAEPPAALFDAEPAAPVMQPEPVAPDAPDEARNEVLEVPGVSTMPRPDEPAAPTAPPTPEPVVASVQRAAPGFFDRIRDAVAVRFALMRSTATDDDLDESVQIVSGTGAPGWGGRRGQDTHRDRRERIAAASAAALERPAEIEHEPVLPPIPVDYDYMPTHGAADTPTMLEPAPAASPPEPAPVSGFAHAPTPIPTPAVAAEALPHELPPHAEPAQLHTPPVKTEPASPGRHVSALQSGRASAKRTWAGLRSLGGARPGRTPIADHALADRRLWVFGAAVVLLLVVGLLAGKSVTLPRVASGPASVPNPTAVALTPPSAAATPAAPAHSAAPTAVPTPAGPDPALLTSAQTLGSGGTGYQVQDLRYGAHPGDFRIVFDLTGASAALPSVQVGFGNPTTLYVEFSGTSADGPPAQPAAGGSVTSIRLLPSSALPGHLVYQLTLSHAVKLSTLYLRDPTRLVIDLS